MLRLFKTIVLYLSMLAIPAQGYAASTMLFCGPAPQGVKTAQEIGHHAAPSHVSISSARHQGHLVVAVSARSAGYASSDEKADIANSDKGLGNAGDSDAHESSEHAACSVGAAIPASSVRFQPEEQAIEPMTSSPFRNTGFVTDGPRRPPRTFPA